MKMTADGYLIIAAAAGLYLAWKSSRVIDTAAAAVTETGGKLGRALADITAPKEWEYLGNASRYDQDARIWYVLVDGRWIVDEYQTAQARKTLGAK